jgi:pyruvate dehydrogenase E1 component alpha subunit
MEVIMTKKPEKNGKSSPKILFTKETYLQWYEVMMRIRRFEERVLKHYGEEVRGFCHVYIGQEAIAAGMVSALRPADGVVTAYRQHGLAIAKGISTREGMAELFGRIGGIVKGKGGSMHFFSKEHNFYGGNGIVGAQIPIGTGIAFAEKYRGTDNLCMTMFGDGAARQGALYESFNMAMTWKLPVLYVCENNLYAMGTSVERTSNVTDIHIVGEAFKMPHEAVDGMDPEAVHNALSKAAAHIRSGKGPYFLEIKTYRYKGHSVSDPEKYRKTKVVENNRERYVNSEEMKHYMNDLDPIKIIENRVLQNKIATQAELEAIEARIEVEIDEATEFALNSPFPDVSELYTDNYVQKDYPFMMD